VIALAGVSSNMRWTIVFPCTAWLFASASAQVIDTVPVQELSFVHHPFVYSTYSSLIDRNDRPYLYTTGLEHGFRTYDINDASAPQEVAVHWPADFDGLKPSNLFQQGDLLYISLGGFQGATQRAGLAIFDVSDPMNGILLDQWDSAAFTTGSAIVRVQGGFAFLGAMESGIVILDVSDPMDVHFVSAYQPDPDWPGIVNYPPNARGLALKGDTLLLAYDAGGIRAIDVTDKSAPFEIGHYVNPQQPPNTADAYNNLRLVGDLCIVATDFCGFEVVDVSDPADMQQVAWVNPWNCMGLSWFGSDGHTNELITARHDSLLFMSGGDSELLIYDITSPAQPQLVGGLIHPNDSSVVWGLDVKDSLVVLNYIDNSTVILPPQPYYANDGGLQILSWQLDISTPIIPVPMLRDAIVITPNPTDGTTFIHLDEPGYAWLSVRDVSGRALFGERILSSDVTLDLSDLTPGAYLIEVVGTQRAIARFVVH